LYFWRPFHDLRNYVLRNWRKERVSIMNGQFFWNTVDEEY